MKSVMGCVITLRRLVSASSFSRYSSRSACVVTRIGSSAIFNERRNKRNTITFPRCCHRIVSEVQDRQEVSAILDD